MSTDATARHTVNDSVYDLACASSTLSWGKKKNGRWRRKAQTLRSGVIWGIVGSDDG